MTKKRAGGGPFDCTLCLQARLLAEQGRYDEQLSGEDFGEPASVVFQGQSMCERHFATARQAILDHVERKRAALEIERKKADDG